MPVSSPPPPTYHDINISFSSLLFHLFHCHKQAVLSAVGGRHCPLCSSIPFSFLPQHTLLVPVKSFACVQAHATALHLVLDFPVLHHRDAPSEFGAYLHWALPVPVEIIVLLQRICKSECHDVQTGGGKLNEGDVTCQRWPSRTMAELWVSHSKPLFLFHYFL